MLLTVKHVSRLLKTLGFAGGLTTSRVRSPFAFPEFRLGSDGGFSLSVVIVLVVVFADVPGICS